MKPIFTFMPKKTGKETLYRSRELSKVIYEFLDAHGVIFMEPVACTIDIAAACAKHKAIYYRPLNPTDRIPMIRTDRELPATFQEK